MMFDYTLGLHGTFCQNGQKMTIFLKLRKRSKNIIFSHQKQLFLILDIILRIWVDIQPKNFDPLPIYFNFSKKCQFWDFLHPSPTSVPNDTIFCQNVLNKSPNTVTERFFYEIWPRYVKLCLIRKNCFCWEKTMFQGFFLNHPQRVARPGGNMAQKKNRLFALTLKR